MNSKWSLVYMLLDYFIFKVTKISLLIHKNKLYSSLSNQQSKMSPPKADSQKFAAASSNVPTFLKFMPVSANPRACGKSQTEVKAFRPQVMKKTDYAFLRMATIAPDGGNQDYYAVCVWLEGEKVPFKSLWQCKVFFDEVKAHKPWITMLHIYERVYNLCLKNEQGVQEMVLNDRGYQIRLYIRFIPTRLTMVQLTEYAQYIANNLNRNPVVSDSQKVFVRVTQDPNDEKNFIIPAHTNTVWSTVLGEGQAYKHLCFFDSSMTGPHWSPDNMDIVNTYFIKGEVKLDNATEMGLDMEWVNDEANKTDEANKVEFEEDEKATQATQATQASSNESEDDFI
jgi:hypothetical protein